MNQNYQMKQSLHFLNKMKLSIIIVNYNTAKITADCLRSIDKFSPKFKFEVILVDNASTDESIKKFKSLKFKNFKLKLIENSKNLGFSKANNAGLEKSSGEYKLLLNSDTLITNNALEELVEFASKTADAGVIGPKLLNKDKSVQESIFRLPTFYRAIKQYWFGQKDILDKYYLNENTAVEVEAVVGAAFLITPKAWKIAGGLDNKYFMYFEDIDYCKKVRELGLKVYYLPSSSIIHLHGASGKNEVNSYLINSSKKYFGTVQYYLYTFILWSGQKLKKVF